MKTEIKNKLKARLDSIKDTDTLFRVMDLLQVNESDLDTDFVWAKIKDDVQISIKKFGQDEQRYLDPRIRDFINDTLGVKLYFDGEWYSNRVLGIKLKPEWIDIIQEETK